MGLFSNLFKSKELKRFERALENNQYSEALSLCGSDQIPASAQAEAQHKSLVYEAVAGASFNDPFREIMHQVARSLKDQAAIQALPNPDQTIAHLAHVANALKTQSLEKALEMATSANNQEGQAQALRMVASHMACMDQSLEKMLQVIKAIPNSALVDEELRNLLLAQILRKDFNAAREILPNISQEIRRGLRPQIDFVERNLDSLDEAQKRARDLVHPDDINLNLALVAGALEKYGWMSQFCRSLTSQLLVGAHTTYATSLAYAGKLFEAVSLLQNIENDGHEYHLRLSTLAINFPLSGREGDIVLDTFAAAEHYEGALAFWYHKVVTLLVDQDIDGTCATIGNIANANLRNALAVLVAEFSYTTKDR